ncbi:hypothetical protein N825_17190 [Skermanella stibiiresistens SB22]|uniref:Uncharacterized protein n=1 Tax=Skermanella stibiiresistens SB22 TaxID=1385369 RepID=W9GUR0_9PROT|nr:hypothetical protein [Skermanella stibiiresistens]EWY37610.1 hypothetical protein N825_17190 [Skermanella stibiiresistens SB22]
MLSEATTQVVTLIALIAIVHFAVTAIIARKLTQDELAQDAGAAKDQGFSGQPANDRLRKAA